MQKQKCEVNDVKCATFLVTNAKCATFLVTNAKCATFLVTNAKYELQNATVLLGHRRNKPMGDHSGKFNYFTIVGHYHICLRRANFSISLSKARRSDGINHCVSNGSH